MPRLSSTFSALPYHFPTCTFSLLAYSLRTACVPRTTPLATLALAYGSGRPGPAFTSPVSLGSPSLRMRLSPSCLVVQ